MSSEHDLQVNIPAGLRDPVIFSSKNAGIVDNLLVTDEERNPTVKSVLQRDIASKFFSPATRLPVLDKDGLDPKFVDPAGSKLDSKFSYADGLAQVTQSQLSDRNVQDIISANHQLRDGNFVGAQDTLGRELTQDEIVRRQVTPSTLTGQYNANAFATASTTTAGSDLRDSTIERLLLKFEQQMSNGDDLSPSEVNYVKHAMKLRNSTQVNPALRDLYSTVMPRAATYAVKGQVVSQPQGPQGDPEEQKGDGIGKIKSGFIKLGKYEIDRKKLHHGGTLSIRYATSKKKVNGFPNCKVSDAMRDNIMQVTTGKPGSRELDAVEQNLFHKLIRQSEADVQLKPLGLEQTGDPVQHLYTMLGEIDAGNDSFKLKQAVEVMLAKLVASSHISTKLAEQIRSSYLH